MKINQIILKENSVSELIEKSEFKQKFPEIKLYHGIGNRASAPEDGIIKFRYREKSRDSSPILHNLVNHLSEKKFGVPIRNLFFCTQSYITADILYDNAKRITPSDGFRMFSKPNIKDFTVDNKFQALTVLETSIEICSDAAGLDTSTVTILDDERMKTIADLRDKRFEVQTFEELSSIILTYIKRMLIDQFEYPDDDKLSDELSKMKASIDGYHLTLKERCEEYINEVIEIKTVHDLTKIHKEGEIMVLAKEFYINKEERDEN